jgi:hypothetical protein
MLVNSKRRAYTQRVEPKLALVEVEMPPEAFSEDWQPTPDDHMGIVRWISARFSDSLRVVRCTLSFKRPQPVLYSISCSVARSCLVLRKF